MDGERVALLHHARTGAGADGRGATPISTGPVFIRAGQKRVSAAFVRGFDGPYEDLIRPHDWSMAGGGSGGSGITTLPHVRELAISGPTNATGVSDNPVRSRIFICRPTSAEEEAPCARRIIRTLASRAYRRPAADADVDGLMRFYEDGAAEDGFESGVRMALEALLASPRFVFRTEQEPEGVEPGEIYAVASVDLASRLSFFLWGRRPMKRSKRPPPTMNCWTRKSSSDRPTACSATRAHEPSAAVSRASGCACRISTRCTPIRISTRISTTTSPMPCATRRSCSSTASSRRTGASSISSEPTTPSSTSAWPPTTASRPRPGSQFRKVPYPDDRRGGLLGHGSILVLTSLANRTSPVLRGKWVMEVLLGTPPPPPPPGIPDLEETEVAQEGRMLTTRERMQIHSEDPRCISCHRFMDPIGLALDNFDVTGKWRSLENGVPLDTRGDFYDGTPVATPAELSAVLLKRPLPLVRNFTENLMAYALGRRVEDYDRPAIREIVRLAEEHDYRVSSLILGVVGSDAFRMRRAAAPAAVDEGGAARPGERTGRR